jgi:hypothetical protein
MVVWTPHMTAVAEWDAGSREPPWSGKSKDLPKKGGNVVNVMMEKLSSKSIYWLAGLL